MPNKDSFCYNDVGWHTFAYFATFGIKFLFWNGIFASKTSEAGIETILTSYSWNLIIDVLWVYDIKSAYWLQEKVACLDDNEARLAVDPHNKYKIQVMNFISNLFFLVLQSLMSFLKLIVFDKFDNISTNDS